jgi:hypothetical protein
MGEGKLDALGQKRAKPALKIPIEILADGVSSQRERTPGHLLPPSAEVGDGVKVPVAVGQLSLVNHDSRLALSALDRLEDAIERNDFRPHLGIPEPECQVCRGQTTGNGDRDTSEIVGSPGLPSDDHGTVSVPKARTGRHQHIAIGEISVTVKGQGGDLVSPLESCLIEGLDILQTVLDGESLGVEKPLGQGIEHEGIVGIRTVSNTDHDG